MLSYTVDLTVVVATGCSNGELRGEELPNISGVELCVDNKWRTVCRWKNNNEWNQRAANIACKQLGYLDKGSEMNRCNIATT